MATATMKGKGQISFDNFEGTPEAYNALNEFLSYCGSDWKADMHWEPPATPARRISGRSTPRVRSGGGGVTRSRTRRRSNTSGNGAAGGSRVTDAQLLAFMQEKGTPLHQREIAGHFGVSATTISRKLNMLVGRGDAIASGRGAQKTWTAKEFAPAA